METQIVPPPQDAARTRELGLTLLRFRENRRLTKATARKLAALPAGADRSTLKADQRRLDIEQAALVTAHRDLPAEPTVDELIARKLAQAVLDEQAESRRAQATDEGPAGETLTARQVAARLGLTKPDGTPRDSFYVHVAPLLGHKYGTRWILSRERVDAYCRGATP